MILNTLSHFLKRSAFPYLLIVTWASSFSLQATPQHLIFTYQDDPSQSFTANWQIISKNKIKPSDANVYYDTVSRKGEPDAYAYTSTSTAVKIKGLDDRMIYRAKIGGLEAATTYYLMVGNADHGYSKEIKIRTLPNDGSRLRFATGGDMGVSKDTRTLLRLAAARQPQFSVIGGDVAYANGKLSNVAAWDTWLKYYTEEMITPDGFQIPIILAIGNHEVRGAYNQPKDNAPFYFGFFAQDEAHSYFSIKFSDSFALIVLDTGHIASHKSQSKWLREKLKSFHDITHVAAVYHVPLYPSHRDFMGAHSLEGRTHWGPIFDEYELTVAFENHDHTYKRSHPMKNGKPSEDGTGTLYLGDGCWGRGTRSINFMGRDYLAKSGSIQHFWMVDVSANEGMRYKAVDIDDQVFDIYPSDGSEVANAEAIFAQKTSSYFIPPEMVEISEMQSSTKKWREGQSDVTITNILNFPISVDLIPSFPRDVKFDKKLKLKQLVIQPRKKLRIPLNLSTSKSAGYKIDKVKFRLKIKVHSKDKKDGPPLLLEEQYRIKAVVSK